MRPAAHANALAAHAPAGTRSPRATPPGPSTPSQHCGRHRSDPQRPRTSQSPPRHPVRPDGSPASHPASRRRQHGPRDRAAVGRGQPSAKCSAVPVAGQPRLRRDGQRGHGHDRRRRGDPQFGYRGSAGLDRSPAPADRKVPDGCLDDAILERGPDLQRPDTRSGPCAAHWGRPRRDRSRVRPAAAGAGGSPVGTDSDRVLHGHQPARHGTRSAPSTPAHSAEVTVKKPTGACARGAAGWSNLLVPDLFVFHAQGGSFKDGERKALMERNLATLYRRWPEYYGELARFRRRDPWSGYRAAALVALAADPRASTAPGRDAMAASAQRWSKSAGITGAPECALKPPTQ